jgi:hypothetical protein
MIEFVGLSNFSSIGQDLPYGIYTLSGFRLRLLTLESRILGEVTPERVEIVRRADHIFINRICAVGLYDSINQALRL